MDVDASRRGGKEERRSIIAIDMAGMAGMACRCNEAALHFNVSLGVEHFKIRCRFSGLASTGTSQARMR